MYREVRVVRRTEHGLKFFELSQNGAMLNTKTGVDSEPQNDDVTTVEFKDEADCFKTFDSTLSGKLSEGYKMTSPEKNVAHLISPEKLVVLLPAKRRFFGKDDKFVLAKVAGIPFFDKDNVYVEDIDPTCPDSLVQKSWKSIGILVPYDDTSQYHKDIMPQRYSDIKPGMEVLALYKNPNGDLTTAYYPATLGKKSSEPTKVTVRSDLGEQFLDKIVEVHGYKIPSVIQRVCAHKSYPLKIALKQQKRREKRKHRKSMGSPSRSSSRPPKKSPGRSRSHKKPMKSPSRTKRKSTSTVRSHKKKSLSSRRSRSRPGYRSRKNSQESHDKPSSLPNDSKHHVSLSDLSMDSLTVSVSGESPPNPVGRQISLSSPVFSHRSNHSVSASSSRQGKSALLTSDEESSSSKKHRKVWSSMASYMRKKWNLRKKTTMSDTDSSDISSAAGNGNSSEEMKELDELTITRRKFDAEFEVIWASSLQARAQEKQKQQFELPTTVSEVCENNVRKLNMELEKEMMKLEWLKQLELTDANPLS